MGRPHVTLRSRLLGRYGPRAALVALALVCVVSLGLRSAWLGAPCREPCHSAADRLLIFDEDYYVNAARIIAGVRPPGGVPYAAAPLYDDPNAEHPQLAKVTVAGLIELLGDGPLAWRLPSLILGTLCLLGMYALVRAAGGGMWLGVGAAALMAADNLLLVHSRIFTLDVYALTGMLWGATAYLRGRPLLAGVAIGVGACTKMVAPYVLAVLALYELLRWLATREGAVRRIVHLVACTIATGAVLIGLLAVLDVIAPPYDNAAGQFVKGGVFAHLSHMFTYAAHQTSPNGPQGIASYPWQWLIDAKSITYLTVNPSKPAPGLTQIRPPVHFLGLISPPILVAGLLGLLVGLVVVGRAAWRAHERPSASVDVGPVAGAGGPGVRGAVRRFVASLVVVERSGSSIWALSLAWFLGTWLPFVALSLLYQRTSYLYYMVIVMPGLYLAAAELAARLWPRRWLIPLWMAGIVAALVLAYPLTPI